MFPDCITLFTYAQIGDLGQLGLEQEGLPIPPLFVLPLTLPIAAESW